MPTYVYHCEENDHEFEIVQAFSDAPIASCPDCGSASRRKISASAVIFKGSGWYSKDNASSGSKSSNGTKPSAESDSESKSSESKSSEKKKDSKSDSSSNSGSGSGKTHSHGGTTHSH